MNVSDSRYRQAVDIIKKITKLLDEDYLVEFIDDPIDHAVDQYLRGRDHRDHNVADSHSDEPVLLSHIHFHNILGDFLGALNTDIPTCLIELSPTQARRKAVALLEQSYEGTHARGYHAALLDANNPQQAGLNVVLFRLAQIIKTQKRQDHTRWTFAYHINPTGWETNCAIAAILLDRCSPGSSSASSSWQVHASSPEQFVDHIPDLLSAVMATDQLAGLVFSK